jgi:hypothetical protein
MALRLGMGLKAELFETVKSYGVESIVNTLRQLAQKNGSIYAPDQFLINDLESK